MVLPNVLAILKSRKPTSKTLTDFLKVGLFGAYVLNYEMISFIFLFCLSF
jgi:hypothetical protein